VHAVAFIVFGVSNFTVCFELRPDLVPIVGTHGGILQQKVAFVSWSEIAHLTVQTHIWLML
jgi:hypothetical protein